MKYIEFGFGNESFINTEIELKNFEYRIRGIPKFDKIIDVYFRFWIGYRVFVISSNGLDTHRKNKRRIKFLFGIQAQ